MKQVAVSEAALKRAGTLRLQLLVCNGKQSDGRLAERGQGDSPRSIEKSGRRSVWWRESEWLTADGRVAEREIPSFFFSFLH